MTATLCSPPATAFSRSSALPSLTRTIRNGRYTPLSVCRKRCGDMLNGCGPTKLNMQVRVGVNTGEVVVRSLHTDGARVEYTPIGHSTALAARLQALASPGA